jgi:hypothetical protein
MIVAIEGLIPDRRAGSSDSQSAPPPSQPDFYDTLGLRQQQGKTIDPQPFSALVEEEDEAALIEPEPAPGSAQDAPMSSGPIFDSRESTFADGFNSSETTPSAPSAPDTRVPFSIKKHPFAGRR